jgi:hypothetical protein
MDDVLDNGEERGTDDFRVGADDVIEIRIQYAAFVDIVLDTQFVDIQLHFAENGSTATVWILRQERRLPKKRVDFLPIIATHDFQFLPLGLRRIQLDKVNHTAYVRIVIGLYGFNLTGRYRNAFRFRYVANKLVYLVFRELIEPHTNEFVLERFVDFANIITYQTEPHIGTTHL